MNFDDKTSFRIREEELERIERVVKARGDLYKSNSHFIRCCIIKQLNKEEAKQT